MAFLRAKGVIPPVPSAIPSLVDQVELSYSKYLTQERGLAPITVKTYLTIVRGFLAEHYKGGPLPFEMLCAREVQGFLTREARKYSPGRAKLLVTAIRSFLLWLYTCGKISTRMDNAIPGVPRWRQASLPRAIEPHEIDRLLQGRQRQTSVERRDYAILLLLARLGLRAHEVLVMTLDDIEWDVPAIVVHGKGGRQDRLPLPQDVGEAIAAYLRSGRPRCSTRVVFIRAKAPFRGLADSTSIGTIVRQALVLAGLHPPHMGAHLLRHSLACSMLDHGATLPEIGEILRHRSLATTGIYAKVDLKALAPLAQEWPLAGGAE